MVTNARDIYNGVTNVMSNGTTNKANVVTSTIIYCVE